MIHDTRTPTDPTTSTRTSARMSVVFNPASGSSSETDELRAAFAAAGVEPHWLSTTEDDPGTGQAADAVTGGADTVVACGGDGTVRAVIQSLAGTASVLGVVPMGTGNLLAGNLGLSTGLDAVDDAVHAPPCRLDVGVINGERFAVMAGVGFDALMIRDASPALKRRLGSAAYVLSAARNLRSKVFHADLAVDGQRVFRGRTAMVLIGNCGAVTGGLQVFPEARYDDGQLDVAVLRAQGARQWLSVGWRLLTRRPQRPDLVRRFRGSKVVVNTGRAVPYELDGEVRDPLRTLTVGIEPGALLVRAPVTQPAGKI